MRYAKKIWKMMATNNEETKMDDEIDQEIWKINREIWHKRKSALVYLQIREDGKVWVVLEDGTPLAHQAGVDTSSSAMKGGVQAVITLQSAGWLPPLIGGSANGD